jgi:hypothetical protein
MSVIYNAAFPYRYPITIDYTKVGASLTDYPLYLDLADAPSQFFTDLGATGGKVRFCSDDGLTEYPYEIVSYDDTAETGEVHVLLDSLSAVSSKKIYAMVGNASASPYAVTDTYGRNNVWGDYAHVYHGDSTTDATGNGATLATFGSPSLGVTGKMGLAYDSGAGEGYYADGISAEVVSGTDTAVLQSWFYIDSDTNPGADWLQSIIYWGRVGDSIAVSVGDGGAGEDKIHAHSRGGNTESQSDAQGTTLSEITWYLVHCVFDQSGNVVTLYINGTQDVQATSYTDNSGAFTELSLGLYPQDAAPPDWSDGMNGKNDEARFRIGAISAGWITTEYNNQNSPSTFYTWGAREDNSAGGGSIFVPTAAIL